MAMIDYLIVVALDEENDYLLKVLSDVKGDKAAPLRLINKRLYSRNILNDGRDDLTIVVLPVGRMGADAMQAATSDAIKTWKPRDIILVGIAGSLEPTRLLLGDVLVPAKVFGCNEGKVTDVKGRVRREFRKTGDRAASDLINTMRAVYFNDSLRKSWHTNCLASINTALCLFQRLREQDPEGVRPSVHIAFNDSLVSGTDVIASTRAAAELKQQVDSTIRAVEMESRGVFESVERENERIRILIVRGISDYADKNKQYIEKTFKDGWRRFSMMNAVRLVLIMIVSRRVIDEKYHPVPLPQVDLVHAPNSWELSAAAKVIASEIGAVAIAFPTLISWSAGTPEILLEIEAAALDGQPLTFRRALIQFSDGTSRFGVIEDRTHLKYKIERNDNPQPLRAFLALNAAPAKIKVSLLDEFSRKNIYEHKYS